MTPDRLVDFIPSILRSLSPQDCELHRTDAIGISQWLNQQRRQKSTDVPFSIHDDLWPQCPTVIGTDYTLAKAPDITPLNIPPATPVRFCNSPGTGHSGTVIPSLASAQRIAEHVLAFNGDIAFSRTDFVLPGPITFTWQRFFRSGQEGGGLGSGWRHTLDEHLLLPQAGSKGAGNPVLHSAEGRRIEFDLPPIGQGSYNRSEKLLLIRQSLHSFRLCAFDRADRIFRADGDSHRASLSEIRDAYGNTLTIDYRAAQPRKVVTSWGQTLRFRYAKNSADGTQHLVEIAHEQSPENTPPLCRYAFDTAEENSPIQPSENQPLQLISAAAGARHERYGYTGGLLRQVQRENGQQWQFDYDRQQRCHRVRHNRQEYRLRWQQVQRRCIVETDGQHPQQWQFDARGNTLHWRQQQREQRFLYDHYNNLCSTLGSDGQRDIFRHDEFGRRVRQTRNGQHQRWVFDAQGRLLGAQYFGDATWKYTYADHPQPVGITDPCGNHWRCEYDERGQLRLLTDPEGGQVLLHWDAQAQVHRIQCVQTCWDFRYDHWHRLTALENSEGRQYLWRYRADGQLQGGSAGGSDFTLDHDEQHRPCRLTRSENTLLQWQHDDYGRIRRIEKSGSSDWQLDYTHSGNLAALQVGECRSQWHYNEFSQPAFFSDQAGREREWQYDPCGRIAEYRECDNHWTLHYGADGRLEKIRNNSGQHCDFHFDPRGRLTQAENNHSSLRFKYDLCDRLIAEHHDIQEGQSLSINHQFDTRGWLKNTGSDNLNQHFLFAPDGALYGIDANGEPALRAEFSETGWTWNQGQSFQQRQLDNGELAAICWGTGDEQRLDIPLQSFPLPAPTQRLPFAENLQQDRRGNVEQETRHLPVSDERPLHYRYQYDGWGLLSSAECGDFKTWFRYDPFGRRLWKISTHRRSARQRKVLTHWWSFGLWSATALLDGRESTTHYLHHPLLGIPLTRLHDGAQDHFITDKQGRLVVIRDTAGETLWQSSSSRGACPEDYSGTLQIFDRETRLLYCGFRYWHPALDTYLATHPTQIPLDGSPAVDTSVTDTVEIAETAGA
mgnify:CR=1 FL=1